MDGSRIRYLLFELGLLEVQNFIGLGIGIVCYFQLLFISALTGKFNRFFMFRCRRSSSSTEPIGVVMPFSASDDDSHVTGVHTNPSDVATIELLFLSVGELRAGPQPVSGISASPKCAFSRRNKLRRSRSSRSCGCSWKSDGSAGRGRCGALHLGQMGFKFSDSLGERRCLVLLLQLCELFLKFGNLFLKHVGLLVLLFGLRYFSGPTLSSGALVDILRPYFQLESHS